MGNEITTYTYASTDLITGETLSDAIPLDVQSVSQRFNGGGDLTGQLTLSRRYKDNLPFLEALTPRRSVLWVMEDFYPIWAGIVLDSQDSTRSQGMLPVSAQTLDFVWSKRLILSALKYSSVDIFQIFIDLLNYGTSMVSPFTTSTSPVTGPPSPAVAAGLPVARLILPAGAAATGGVEWTTSYLPSDLKDVSSAWSDLAQSGNLEYYFDAGLDQDGQPAVFVRLGFDLGRNYEQAGYSVVYPGNALDYGKQVTGSQGANVVIASASPNGNEATWVSQYPHGWDLADLEAGYPVMMSSASFQGSNVTSQQQINQYASGQLSIVSQGMVTPVVMIGGSGRPVIRDLRLGDTFPFAATSDAAPAGPGGAPGYQALLRLTGWTLSPPSGEQPGSIQLTTSQFQAAT